jgi:hypothetical protein
MNERILQQLTELESHIKRGDIESEKVSSKGTYWHVDHALSVIQKVTQSLNDSKPSDFEPHRSFLKTVILFTGYMPRGKGRAPKQTISADEISMDDLTKSLTETRVAVKKLSKTGLNKAFNHPLFGWLTKKETVRFIGIHTHHHLKIIRDIKKE